MYMKKIDTWLDIQRFIAEAEIAIREYAIPRENEEFVRVDISEVAEGEGVRKVFYSGHI